MLDAVTLPEVGGNEEMLVTLEIVERVLTDDLKPLAAAVARLLTRVEQAEAAQTQLDLGGEESGDAPAS